MKVLIACAIALLVPLSYATQSSSSPDLGALGSYAIGHTSVAVVDSNADPSGVRGARPIGVSVWYPVDASDVLGKTPDGLYPFDPLYSARQPKPTSADMIAVSSDFEDPCDNLTAPDPAHPELCEARATHFQPTYEAVVPSAHGPFPLVVFSPGWGNPANAYAFFAERLASHGFVVAVLQHYLDGYPSYDCTKKSGPPPTCDKDLFGIAMYNRPRDMSFVLDTLLAKNNEPSDLLYNSINPDLVAAAGHSIGGYATLVLAGGDDAICKEETETAIKPVPCTLITDASGNTLPTMPDPRFKAIVTLDAGNQHLEFNELGRITVPSLTMGEWFGGPDWSTRTTARQHAAMSGEPKYRADVVGAIHNSFQNNCTGSWVRYRHGWLTGASVLAAMNQPFCATPVAYDVQLLRQDETLQLSSQYAIAFLRTYLVGEAGYQDMLTPGWAITREQNIQFFVTEPTSDNPLTFLYFTYQRGGKLVEAPRD